MKSTVVPAQVTTVEDKIAGSISLTQLILLIAPVMLTGLLFALFPPIMQLTALKITIAAVTGLVCVTLAIRVKGDLILHWLLTIGRYNLRPLRYVLDKNDGYLRSSPEVSVDEPEEQIEDAVSTPTEPIMRQLATVDIVRLQSAISDPRSQFELFAKKGGLSVSIYEIKEDRI